MKQSIFRYSGVIKGLQFVLRQALEAIKEREKIDNQTLKREILSNEYYLYGNSDEEADELDFRFGL